MSRSLGRSLLTLLVISVSSRAQPPKVDRHGDPLPTMAIARFGTTRWRVTPGSTGKVAFSPDGKALLVVDDDRVLAWDIGTAKRTELFRLQPEVKAVVLSDGGKTLLVLHEPRSERNNLPFEQIRQIIETWDVGSGRAQKSTEFIHKRPFGGDPQFLKNGRFLVTSEWVHANCLWDVANAKKVVELPHDPDDFSMGMDVSPDGKWLAASTYRRGAYLYDRQTGKSVRRIGDDCSRMFKPCFTPNGKSIVTMGRQSMWVWDAATGQLEREILNCRGTVAFSPDGKVMACADEDAIRLFELRTFGELKRLDDNLAGFASDVRFSPDGKLLAVANANTVSVWSVASGKRLHALPGHWGQVTSLTFSHNGKLLASGGDVDGAAIIWNVATQKPVHRLTGHYMSVTALSFSQDDSTLASGDGRAPHENNSYEAQIRLWDVASGRLVKQFTGHLNGIHCLSFSPDGRRLVSAGGDGKTRLWEIATGQRLAQLFGEDGRKFVKFAPDGKAILVAGERGELAVWKPDLSEAIRKFGDKGQTIRLADFLSSGSLASLTLLPREAMELNLREPPNDKPLKTVTLASRSGQQFEICSISSDGKLLAAVPNDYRSHRVQIWDLESHQMLVELYGHAGHVNAVTFSPDSRFLATGSHDTTILLWDVSFIRVENVWNDLLDEPEQVIRKYKSDTSRLIIVLRDRVAKAAAAEAKATPATNALDDANFSKRRQAQLELRQLGVDAEFAIRNRLQQSPSAQTARTLNALLRMIERDPGHTNHFDGKRLHAALALLERLNTAEARDALKALASGPAESSLTKDAKAAIERLQKPAKP